ncbi:Gfo/Idh/MocA family oxidoreductase [Algisphaera agarilytica]|uniref:Putative dehydrogenase n=1 Tax=Algisphaera agarilytica TaxID=1385975 RepID=A0A7X0HBG7_9BACT|nr:Gfo/Idh/MocA family oxidoreductase [Algisphaera agarilytica]MBB6431349.1 putative dehydrogenase [Algisphaera agarilytica]
MNNVSRRTFLKSSAAVGAATFLPPHIALGNTASTGVAPSEKVNVAFIASSGKGYRNCKAFMSTGLLNVVALCDVDLNQDNAKESAAMHPGAKQFTDFRKMFDEMEDQIDAVVVSTPDHSHFAATMHAMMLGKHVWCEKPLAHTFGQCERLMQMAEKTGVVTQMGNQGHSSGNMTQFQAWTEAGVIKDVTHITAYMNKGRRWHGWGSSTTGYPSDPMPEGMNWDAWTATAVEKPFSNRLHPGNWRSWFDYGCGCFGDWGPHILDTAHRFLKLGYPDTIEAVKLEGANDFVYPQASTIRFDFPERHGMPACEVTWYDGVDNIPVVEPEYGRINEATGERDPLKIKADSPGKIIYGKDLTFQGGSHGKVLQVIPRDKYKEVHASLPKFETKMSNHWLNFLLACKGEEESRSPFSASAPLSQVFNLGMLAQRFGGSLEFDAKTKQITNHELANAMLDPAPRRGWEEYYRA